MEQMVYSRKEAAESIGVGLNKLDEMLNRRERPMPSIRVGRRVIIPIKPLEAWLADEAEKKSWT